MPPTPLSPPSGTACTQFTPHKQTHLRTRAPTRGHAPPGMYILCARCDRRVTFCKVKLNILKHIFEICGLYFQTLDLFFARAVRLRRQTVVGMMACTPWDLLHRNIPMQVQFWFQQSSEHPVYATQPKPMYHEACDVLRIVTSGANELPVEWDESWVVGCKSNDSQ